MSKLRLYVEKWSDMLKENIGLLLWGGVGSGKTFGAVAVANAVIDGGSRAVVTSFPRILNGHFAATDKNEYLDNLVSPSLLVIDDFGVERQTEYALEVMYSVIDWRNQTNRPLVITTNMPLDAFKHPENMTHKRIYSRILGLCTPIKFTSPDRRKDEGAQKTATLRTMLEGDQ